MTGRRRKTLKPLKVIVNLRRKADSRENDEVEECGWSELPPELLELIFSSLKLEDNVRASAVCKSWNSVACAVRVVSQSPWIMYFPKQFDLYEYFDPESHKSHLYEFYDPKSRKTHFVELPELAHSSTCYTKDGWLLLYKFWARSLYFFNPFTRELMNLPKLTMRHLILAFSAAPISGDCVVFTLKDVTPAVVTVSTYRPGDTEWTTVNYENHNSSFSSFWNKLVFCEGKFYSLSSKGWLGVYDPLESTWNATYLLNPDCPESFIGRNWSKSTFMAEYCGEIFVIYICSNESPILYKLDQENMEWSEMETMDGATIFASFLTSHSRKNLLGLRPNSIYFPKVRLYGKRCILYSLDKHRYYPHRQCPDWEEQDPFETLWIEPPKDFTGFT